MTLEILSIPLHEIDDEALPRDRIRLDEADLTELRMSIAASGLRLPVELFHLAEETREGQKYGILSGYRRVQAFRGLRAMTGKARYEAIPAFLRELDSVGGAYVAMVEENEIRVNLSSWERARIAVTARDHGIYESIDSAVKGLFPNASRQKQSRLRTIAGLVEELASHLTTPETWSETQCLRVALACQKGFADLIRVALEELSATDPESQWQTLLPILNEAEAPPPHAGTSDRRPGRPRRFLRLREGLTIRREVTRDGFILHLTGRDAKCPLLERVLEEIERLLSPA